MATASGRPTIPGWGKAPRMGGKLMLGSIVLFLAAVLGAFVFISVHLQKLGGGEFSKPEDLWSDLQEQQFERYGLLTFYHRAKKIDENIDALQKEIDLYHRKFNALEVNETGKRLIKDEWTVRYFADKWNEPLPSERVGKECRERLNVLMYTVIKALEKIDPETERGAYKIDSKTKAAVSQIEFEVEQALKEYTSHRLLLDELEIRIARGETVTPQSLREAAEKLRRERIVAKDWDHPMFDKPTEAEQSSGRRTDAEPPERTDREPTAGDESELLHDVRDAQSEMR